MFMTTEWSRMFTKDFWKDALERTIRTGIQVFLGMAAPQSTGVIDFGLDYGEIGVVTAGTMLFTLLTAIVSVGGPEGKINVTLPGNQREAKAAEIGKLSDEDVERVYGTLYEDEDETYGGQVTLGEYDPRVRK